MLRSIRKKNDERGLPKPGAGMREKESYRVNETTAALYAHIDALKAADGTIVVIG